MHACNSRLHVRRTDAEPSPAHAPRPIPWPWYLAWPLHARSTRTRKSSQPVQCMRAQAFDALSTQHEEALRTHAALMHENGGLREKMTLLELALASRLFKRARWCTACHQGRMGREASGLGCSTHSGRAPQPLRQAVAARVQPSACAMPRISLTPRLLPPQAVKRVVRYFTFALCLLTGHGVVPQRATLVGRRAVRERPPYATQGSNPGLADPRQVCYPHA